MCYTRLVSALVFATGFAMSESAFAQSNYFSFERGVNRPGLNYNSFSIRSAAACSFACQSENRCVAWNYVRPGICWLKDAGPSYVYDDCCVSGRSKKSRRSQVID